MIHVGEYRVKCISQPDWYEYDVSHDNLMVQISPSGNHFIKCSIVPVIAASPEGEAPRCYLKWSLCALLKSLLSGQCCVIIVTDIRYILTYECYPLQGSILT